MPQKIVFTFTLVLLLVFGSLDIAEAKRLLPQTQTIKSGITRRVVSQGVTVSVTFREDRNGILATFTNLKIAKEVGYTLVYKNAQNIEQAVQSSIDVNAPEPVTREFLFGTCSTNNVCQYDSDVRDAKFIVTTTLKTGKKVIKTFNLKVKK
jgi:hypothetical protein